MGFIQSYQIFKAVNELGFIKDHQQEREEKQRKKHQEQLKKPCVEDYPNFAEEK